MPVEQLKQVYDDNTPLLKEYIGNLSKFCETSNVLTYDKN